MQLGSLATLWLITTLVGAVLSERVFVQEPEDQLLVQGSSVPISLTCEANVDNPTYQWMKDLVSLPPQSNEKYEYTGGTLKINNPDEADVGGYQCVVRMSGGNLVVSNFGNITLAYINEFQQTQYQLKINEGMGAEVECQGQGEYAPEHSVQYGWNTVNEWKSFTSQSQEPRFYVSFRTGSLYIANAERDDTDRYECQMRSRKYEKAGQPIIEKSSQFTVTVNPVNYDNSNPAAFLLRPDDITYAVLGKNTFIECFAQGNPTPEITWSKVDGEMPVRAKKKGSGLLKIGKIREEDAGVYRCTASNGGHDVYTDTEIQFEYSPQWVAQIASAEVDVSTTAILTCTARGSPRVDLFWMKNGNKLEQDGVKVSIIESDVEESVLYIHNFEDKDAGIYQCVASNKHGTILSSAELEAVDSPPTFVEKLPDVLESAVGGEVFFPCEVEAAPPAEMLWFKDDTELAVLEESRLQANEKGLTIAWVESDDAGLYTCSATNFRGSINSTGKLEVFEATQIVSATEPEEMYVAGDWIILTCQASYDNSLALTWTWTFNGKTVKPYGDAGFDLSGATLEIYASGDKSGVYECTAKTSVGSSSAEMIVNVQDVPNKPENLRTEPKSGDSIYLTWEIANSEHTPLLSQQVQQRLFIDQSEPGEWFDSITNPDEIIDQTGCLVTGLQSYNFYQFRVRASNKLGHGDYSDESDAVRTKEGTPAKIPQLLKGGGGKPGELVVEWEPLDLIDYGAASVTYLIKAWKVNTTEETADTNIVANPVGNRTVFTTPSNEIYEPYNARIQVQNSMDEMTEWSPISVVYSGELAPEEAVEEGGVKLINRKSFSALFKWKPIENKNGFTKGYKVVLADTIVDADKNNPETWLNYTTISEEPYIELDELTAMNAYNYKISPYNSAGVGPWTGWMGPFMTRKYPPSRAPTNLHLEVLERDIDFSWDPVTAALSEEEIIGYKVTFWKEGQSREEAEQKISVGTRVYFELPDRSEYLIAVRAYSRGGDGPSSDIVRFSTYIGLSIKQFGAASTLSVVSAATLAFSFLLSLYALLV